MLVLICLVLWLPIVKCNICQLSLFEGDKHSNVLLQYFPSHFTENLETLSNFPINSCAFKLVCMIYFNDWSRKVMASNVFLATS